MTNEANELARAPSAAEIERIIKDAHRARSDYLFTVLSRLFRRGARVKKAGVPAAGGPLAAC